MSEEHGSGRAVDARSSMEGSASWRGADRDLVGTTTGSRRGLADGEYGRLRPADHGGRLRDAVGRLDHLAHLAVTHGEVLRPWNPTPRASRRLLGQAADGLTEICEAVASAPLPNDGTRTGSGTQLQQPR